NIAFPFRRRFESYPSEPPRPHRTLQGRPPGSSAAFMRLFRGGPTPFREGAFSVSLQTDARQPCHAKRVWAQPVSNRNGHHEISRGRRGRSRRILPSRPDCLNGISKICWKIDSRANVRTDTQPPGYGSEPHLDFVVTDLDGMLAQLCGPGALGCGQGFRAARLQSNFAVLTSHVSARLGSRRENSAARLPERIFQEC